MACFWNTVIDL